MSALSGDLSQQLTLSSTHSPTLPISLIPLSLEWRTRRKQELEWESGGDGEQKMDLTYQWQQEQLWIKIMDFNHLSSHGWFKSSLSSPSWGQSPNPNPSLFSCLDGSWGLLGKRHPKDENQVCCSSISLLYQGFSWNSESLVVLANQGLNPKYPKPSKLPKPH